MPCSGFVLPTCGLHQISVFTVMKYRGQHLACPAFRLMMGNTNLMPNANLDTMEMEIKITTILFDNRISPHEIPLFRGCVIRLADGNPYFHNHTDSGFAYSYPMVQYKCLCGHAAVVGVNEGADILLGLFRPGDSFPCQWGRKFLDMRVVSVRTEVCNVGISDNPKVYLIDSWLPLNQNNYGDFCSAQSHEERLRILEKILTGNILSFAKGMRLFFDRQVTCRILHLEEPEHTIYKGVGMIGFSAVFTSNVFLPENIGLGKSASLNHGTIKPQ